MTTAAPILSIIIFLFHHSYTYLPHNRGKCIIPDSLHCLLFKLYMIDYSRKLSLAFFHFDQVSSVECLEAPALFAFFRFSFTGSGLASMTALETAPGACFLFPADQIILPMREKSRKTDPLRIRRGSIYSHRKLFYKCAKIRYTSADNGD